MTTELVTIIARNKMLLARAGKIILPKIAGIAFGNAGVNENGELVELQDDQIELNHELLRKPYESLKMISEFICRYTGKLERYELTGEKINEIGLYDEEGDLLYIRHFYDKTKDVDIEMEFQIDDTF